MAATAIRAGTPRAGEMAKIWTRYASEKTAETTVPNNAVCSITATDEKVAIRFASSPADLSLKNVAGRESNRIIAADSTSKASFRPTPFRTMVFIALSRACAATTPNSRTQAYGRKEA